MLLISRWAGVLANNKAKEAQLEEALTALESARSVYQAAGLLQYESGFERRLQSLRQLIAQRPE